MAGGGAGAGSRPAVPPARRRARGSRRGRRRPPAAPGLRRPAPPPGWDLAVPSGEREHPASGGAQEGEGAHAATRPVAGGHHVAGLAQRPSLARPLQDAVGVAQSVEAAVAVDVGQEHRRDLGTVVARRRTGRRRRRGGGGGGWLQSWWVPASRRPGSGRVPGRRRRAGRPRPLPPRRPRQAQASAGVAGRHPPRAAVVGARVPRARTRTRRRWRHRRQVDVPGAGCLGALSPARPPAPGPTAWRDVGGRDVVGRGDVGQPSQRPGLDPHGEAAEEMTETGHVERRIELLDRPGWHLADMTGPLEAAEHRPTVGADEDVVGVDRTVDDAEVVEVGQGGGQRRHQAGRPPRPRAARRRPARARRPGR